MRPGQAYALTETGPAGYTLVSIDCTIERRRPRDDHAITLNANETGTCTSPTTTSRAASRWSRGRQRHDRRDRRRRPTGRWPRPARRRSRARRARPTVTNAAVNAGTYTLSESGGPAGYTPRPGRAPARRATGQHRDRAARRQRDLHDHQHRGRAQLTLVKQVDNGTTGATATPANWTLAAAGPTPLSGASGYAGGHRRRRSRWAPTRCRSRAARPATPPRRGRAPGVTADGQRPSRWRTGQQATCTIVNTAVAAPPHARQAGREHLGRHGRADRLALSRGRAPSRSRAASATPPSPTPWCRSGTYTLAESGVRPATPPSHVGLHRRRAHRPGDGHGRPLAAGDSATCTITNTDQPATADADEGRRPGGHRLRQGPRRLDADRDAGGHHRPGPGVGQRRSDDAGRRQRRDGVLRLLRPVRDRAGRLHARHLGLPGRRASPASASSCRPAARSAARSRTPRSTPTLTLVKVGRQRHDRRDDAGHGVDAARPPVPRRSAGRPAPPRSPTPPVQVGTYTLTESGPPGYTRLGLGRARAAPASTASSVTLSRGPVRPPARSPTPPSPRS